jgi:threonyl-tRNA synthetase
MSEDNLLKVRHTLSHVLARVILKRDPGVRFAIGPATNTGFYYDFEFSEGAIPSESDLAKIEKEMRIFLKEGFTPKRKELSKEDARELFKDQPYKLELIDGIEGSEAISTYTMKDFTDLCEGPHIASSDDIDPDGFTLSHIAGAYWRGDEKNKMLTRIYGIAFENKKVLDAYILEREEARARDHKKLGHELDLYYIDEKVGKGLPMWTPKGTAIKFELESFTRNLEKKFGYQHVVTPYLGSEELYKTSGHLDHYRENMYAPIDMDGDVFYLRPMACPHHIRLLQRKPISYRDLPIRYAEVADYNRYEKSGELMGMIRVRKFQLTDAHIFVASEQLKEEFKNVCRLISEGMTALGLASTVTYRFSKRDPHNKEKYFANDELWNKSESMMKEALDEIGFVYIEAEDEAAFYGPKLDVQARNVNGKEDTLFTAQIDFLLPERFNITYTDQDGKEKRPVMIHRSAIGSLERTFAFLIEHYGGNFPLWLSPVQVSVLPIAQPHQTYAREVVAALKEEGIRVELDESNETLGKKIRNTKIEKIPYFLVIGDSEVSGKEVTLESRDDGKIGSLTIESLLERLATEIKERT